MSVPVDITFRGLDPSASVRSFIEDQAAKLERYCADMLRCHVILEGPKHRQSGNPYHVTLYLTLPGEDVVVSHHPQTESSQRQTGVEERTKSGEVRMQAKDPNIAVSEAFKRARRRLEDHVRLRRGKVKFHEEAPHGRIVRLFGESGYGFIETADGREIYFHRSSLIDADFDRLAVGSRVAFVEELGEKGPQASTLRLLD
jgi:cold shock CspA family protein/ribosome-associated translation inhibitor RaiA